MSTELKIGAFITLNELLKVLLHAQNLVSLKDPKAIVFVSCDQVFACGAATLRVTEMSDGFIDYDLVLGSSV